MGPENCSQYQAVKNNLQKNGVPMVILPPEEFSKHIPNVNLSAGDGALVDTTAGVLFADRALRAVQVGVGGGRGRGGVPPGTAKQYADILSLQSVHK